MSGVHVCREVETHWITYIRRGRMVLTPLQELLGAQEKFPGLWLGSLIACLVYCIACIAHLDTDDDNYGDDGSDSDSSFVGIDSATTEPLLLALALLFISVTIMTWACLVLLPPNSGLVDTRETDFE